MDWCRNVYIDYPEVMHHIQPDNMRLTEEFQFNDPYLNYYMTNPAFAYYPVTGVTWLQVQDYLQWKTDRMNEWILVEVGFGGINPQQVNEDNFSLEAFLLDQYEPVINKPLRDEDPNGDGTRDVRLEDNILLPGLRLPTEEEWRWAAQERFQKPLDMEAYAQPMKTSYNYHPYGRYYYPLLFGRMFGIVQHSYRPADHESTAVSPIINGVPQRLTSIADYQGRAYGVAGMKGQLKEWVMDKWHEKSDTGRSFQEVWKESGFSPARMGDIADDKGHFRSKDSLGRMSFHFWNSHVRLPLKVEWVERTYNEMTYRTPLYTLTDTAYSSPFIVKRYLPQGDTLQRAVVGSTWITPNPSARDSLREDRSSVLVSFRCAMSYTDTPLQNNFKVNWNNPSRAKLRR